MTGVRGTALVTERRVEHAGATTSGDRNGDGLSPTTSGADLTPTVAWSRRVRWVGGLIQAAFAAFWLVRGSVVLGGGVAAVLIAVFGVIVVGVFVYAIRADGGHGPAAAKPGGEANRAGRHDRDSDRVCRGDCAAGDRQRGWSFGLGAAVDRDHDRTAAAVARSTESTSRATGRSDGR